jgi:ribosome biogenesis ATPase
MAKLRLSGDFDYAFLAKSTPGYVGADLSALTGAAGVIAVKRIFEQLGEDAPIDLTTTEGAMGLLGEVTTEEAMIMDEESTTPSTSIPTTPAAEDVPPPSLEAPVPVPAVVPPFATLPPSLAALPIASFLRTHPSSLTSDQLSTLALTNADFTRALSIVQPSSQREGFTTVPDVTWEDLGALQAVREEMRMSIVRPIRRPDVFKMLGLNAPCGVLLWGPPGCGKTLLAKAVANESRANFISVKGPELLNKVSSNESPVSLLDVLTVPRV